MEKKRSRGRRLDIVFPVPLIQELDEYAERKGFTTRTAAILYLIRAGLNLETERDQNH